MRPDGAKNHEAVNPDASSSDDQNTSNINILVVLRETRNGGKLLAAIVTRDSMIGTGLPRASE